MVSIVISKHLEDVEREKHSHMYPVDGGKKPARKSFFKDDKVPSELIDIHGMVQIGSGSGFIVSPEGIILTNKHVITELGAKYTVILSSGGKYDAQVISRDPINDVAILKIQDLGDLPVASLGDATTLQLGQTVLAIGNALGIFKNTVSVGIVSGLSRSISAQANPNSPPQELRGLIQTDAAINPGNSGGPLVNSDGLVIGINAAIVSGAENISLAIPINAAERDLADVRAYGRIRRPYLGVRYVTIDEKVQSEQNLPVDYGALIVREGPHDHGVVMGSPAQKAGLQDKDIILTCNGERIDSDHAIQDVLEDVKVDDVLTLRVLRGIKEFTTNVVLAERN